MKCSLVAAAHYLHVLHIKVTIYECRVYTRFRTESGQSDNCCFFVMFSAKTANLLIAKAHLEMY